MPKKTKDSSGNIGLPNSGHTAFPSMTGLVQNAIDQQSPLPVYPNQGPTLTQHQVSDNPPAGDYHGRSGGRTASLPGAGGNVLPLPMQSEGPKVPGTPKRSDS